MQFSKDYEILMRYKKDGIKIGEGYPIGVFYGNNPEQAREAILDLHRRGILNPKDEDGFFWILTEKGKNYIDKIDALQ